MTFLYQYKIASDSRIIESYYIQENDDIRVNQQQKYHPMEKEYVADQKFSGTDFQDRTPLSDEYEGCTFNNCIFSKTDLSDRVFVECSFYDCDLSMAEVNKTAFRDIYFQGCKLIGLHFEDCNPFLLSMHFQGCQLNYSTFLNMNLKKMKYVDSSLLETDFTGSDLAGMNFANCDLEKAVFQHSKLDNADFRTAYNYIIDPEINSIRKARFSPHGLIGLLAKYGIKVE